MQSYANINDGQLQAEILCDKDGFVVRGTTQGGRKLKYWAANPPDYHLSLAGTALPFANQEMAFEPSMNVGELVTEANGSFKFRIAAPNSYYTCAGRQLIPPHLNFSLDVGDNNHKLFYVPLGNGYRGRSLTSLPGRPNRAVRR